jgi:YbgC/YbaW family acyl-CoA thioester hydrolase
MQRQDFRTLQRIEVRWSEVDAQKIVFNAHYLMYADVAVTDYWRQLGLPYESSFAALGGELFVKKATTTYHAPATLGDVLHVGIRCARHGRLRKSCCCLCQRLPWHWSLCHRCVQRPSGR